MTAERVVVCEGQIGGPDERLIQALLIDRLTSGVVVTVKPSGGNSGLGGVSAHHAAQGKWVLSVEDRDKRERSAVENQLIGARRLSKSVPKTDCFWRRRSVEAYLLQPEVLLAAARGLRSKGSAVPLPADASAMALQLDRLAAPMAPALAVERALSTIRGRLSPYPLQIQLTVPWSAPSTAESALHAAVEVFRTAADAASPHPDLTPEAVASALAAATSALTTPEVDAAGNNPLPLWQLVDGHKLMGKVAEWLSSTGRPTSAVRLTDRLVDQLHAFPDAAAPELATLRACLGG